MTARVLHEQQYGCWLLRACEYVDDERPAPAWTDTDAPIVLLEVDAVLAGQTFPFADRAAGLAIPLDPRHPAARDAARSVVERTRGGGRRSRLTVADVISFVAETRLLTILEGSRRSAA